MADDLCDCPHYRARISVERCRATWRRANESDGVLIDDEGYSGKRHLNREKCVGCEVGAQRAAEETMAKHSYLVTGGCGFVGYNLCRRLLDNGHTVHVLDDLSNTIDARVDDLRRQPLCNVHVQDVREWPWRFPGSRAVDRVFHLACHASPPLVDEDPVKVMTTIMDGMRGALEFAAECDECRVVFTSSSEVYGNPQTSPQHEEFMAPMHIYEGARLCYQVGKRAAESMSWAYREKGGVDARVVRLFNCYGPGMKDDGRMVPRFVKQALAGDEALLHGGGRQTRSLCYVDDTVLALRKVMDAWKWPGQPVNVGNPCERTVHEIASLIYDEAGRQRAFRSTRPVPHDPQRRCPDVSRIGRVLGWAPKVPLEEGVARVVDAAFQGALVWEEWMREARKGIP